MLSLVSGAEITQLGASEFEHVGATDVWVGPANKNDAIPAAIQNDMAEALAMTLSTGQVDCKVSPNIRQQQYERMIGWVSENRFRSTLANPHQANCISPSKRSFRSAFPCRLARKSWRSVNDSRCDRRASAGRHVSRLSI